MYKRNCGMHQLSVNRRNFSILQKTRNPSWQIYIKLLLCHSDKLIKAVFTLRTTSYDIVRCRTMHDIVRHRQMSYDVVRSLNTA